MIMGDAIPTPGFPRVGHGAGMTDSDMRSGRYGFRVRDGLHSPSGRYRGPWRMIEGIKYPTEAGWM